MKAVILLGTLKKDSLSNTETLVDFFVPYLQAKNVKCEVIKSVEYNILPGTYTHMGAGDAWPDIFRKLVEAQIIIFATPIWWSNHSSETQKIIERLDEVHDDILAGKESSLANKAIGIIITGDSDGSQHIIGSIANFANALGMIVPPYASLTVQAAEHTKDQKISKESLMEKYEKEYATTAETMAAQLIKFASLK